MREKDPGKTGRKIYHVIVTSNDGTTTTFQVSTRKILLALALLAGCFGFLLIVSHLTIGAQLNERLTARKISALRTELAERKAQAHEYRDRTALLEKRLLTEQDVLRKEYEAQLTDQLTTIDILEKQRVAEIGELTTEHKQMLAAHQREYETALSDREELIVSLQAQHRQELEGLRTSHAVKLEELHEIHELTLANQRLRSDLENTTLRLANIELLNTAVKDLNERSALIESVMERVGVKIVNPIGAEQVENIGGPFVPMQIDNYQEVLEKTADYVQALQTLPLGKPVNTKISSPYGPRKDPINGKMGFHEGVDFKGRQGDKIRTTAGGTVVKAGKNGSYGNYIEIDHGNGYHTAYAHLHTIFVKKGEIVRRGDTIGELGRSGRTTGAHLHYEVLLNGKHINPYELVKIATLTHTFGAQ
jgi:murein DD-endopeptidase MepM/ murein hydrolase activator NlpD